MKTETTIVSDASYLGRIVDKHFLFGGHMDSFRPDFSSQELVHYANVTKSSSRHDEIVPAPTSIGIEVLALNAFGDQKLCSYAVLVDVTGWRNVVGGDTVAKIEQTVSILDSESAWWCVRHALEEGGVMDVGRLGIPLIERTLRGCELVPHVIPFRDGLVGSSEHLREN